MSLGQAVFVIPILKGWLVLCRFALEYCIIYAEETSVSDLDSLISDPDPAFKAEYRSGSGSNPDPGF